MSWTKLGNLDWYNRDPNEFFDSVVKTNEILNRFTLYDGIKSQKQVPIFEATLIFDNSKCAYTPRSTSDISEKTFYTSFRRWGYQNCKNALEDSYRSTMLKKGQLNAETLDGQFQEWVFDYFVKLNGQELLDWSWNGNAGGIWDGSTMVGSGTDAGEVIDGIRAELVLESTYATDILVDGTAVGTTHDMTDETEVLTHFRAAYKGISAANKAALFNGADREFKPVIACNTNVYQAYQLAIADYGVEYAGIEKGLLKTFLGMEVVHYPALADTEIFITPLSNLVLAVDEYSDADAIQAKYDDYTNSDNIWGQYMVGFSYKKPENITHYLTELDA